MSRRKQPGVPPAKAASAEAKKPELPAHVHRAIEEQQYRVLQLQQLIRCVGEAPRQSDDDSAFAGLADYADSIFLALDPGTVAERAQEIRAEGKQS